MKITTARAGLAAISMGVLSCGVNSASAAETGFYVAGDIGISSYDQKKSELDGLVLDVFDSLGFDVVGADSDFDKSAVGFDLAAGYRFSPYLAVEAAYVRLGKAKYDAEGTVTDGVDDHDAIIGIDLESSGPAVSALASWPVNERLSLDGRVGVFLAKSKAKVMVSDGVDSDSESDSDTDNSLLFGVGGTWAFTSATGLRIGYTVFKDAFGGERDVSLFSIGMQHTFGR